MVLELNMAVSEENNSLQFSIPSLDMGEERREVLSGQNVHTELRSQT